MRIKDHIIEQQEKEIEQAYQRLREEYLFKHNEIQHRKSDLAFYKAHGSWPSEHPIIQKIESLRYPNEN